MKLKLLLLIVCFFVGAGSWAQELNLPLIEKKIQTLEQGWQDFAPSSKEEVNAVQILGQMTLELREIKEKSTKNLASTQKNIEALGDLSTEGKSDQEQLKKQAFDKLIDQEKQQILYAELLLKGSGERGC